MAEIGEYTPLTVEEAVEEAAAETAEEEPVEAAEEAEETVEEPAEEPAEETAEAAVEAEVEAAPLPEIPVEKKTVKAVQLPLEPVSIAGPSCDINLWVEQLIRWCRSKGMQCITTMDDGDCYLHVYLPYKKDVHTVGAWCFKKDANPADLAAEISRLYAYCQGFADCFAKLIK